MREWGTDTQSSCMGERKGIEEHTQLLPWREVGMGVHAELLVRGRRGDSDMGDPGWGAHRDSGREEVGKSCREYLKKMGWEGGKQSACGGEWRNTRTSRMYNKLGLRKLPSVKSPSFKQSE